MRRRVSRDHVTTQQAAMLMVLFRTEDLNVTELAERTGVDFGGTSRLVDRLQAKGFLSVCPDGADRRARRINLTRKGRAVGRRAVAASRATNEVFIKRITWKEVRQFRALLEKLLVPRRERTTTKHSA